MTPVHNPLADPARLAALRRLKLLDSEAEAGFDRLTKLAAQVIGVPVCLVSLVDDGRQFFKSALGLGGPAGQARQTPLTHSFCQHVVTAGAPLVVDDAPAHSLVCDNLAIRDLGVMAYLGVPIRSPAGFVLGSLCVIDTKPRKWAQSEIDLMVDFAGLVDTEIALQAALIDKDAVLMRQRAVMDGTTFSVIATTPDGVIDMFNAGAERMLGYAAGEMVGRQTPVVIHLAEEIKARAEELSMQLGRRIEPGLEAVVARSRSGGVDEREWTYVRKDGSRLPVLLTISPLLDQAGVITGFLSVAQDLTERKKIEVALQASEERLHRVLSHADCLVWEAQVVLDEGDWNWQFNVHPSGLYRRLTGNQDSAASAGLWYQFEIPEQGEMNRRCRTALEAGARGYEQEFRLRHKGQVSWIRESVSITPTGPGRFWVVGVAVDATAQKKAQAARDESVARLHKLGSLLPGMIFQFRRRPDGTSCFPYASEGIHQIFHLSPDEVRDDASRIFALLRPDDVAAMRESMLVSARTLQPWQREFPVRFADGAERWLLGHSVPEREADGGVLWHGFITDITERKVAEAGLRASEEFNRRIVDNSDDCLKILSLEARLIDMAAPGRRLMCVKSFDEIRNADWFSFWQGEDRAAAQHAVQEAREGRPGHFQGFCPTLDGTPKWWDVMVSPLNGPDGKPEQLLSISRDITESKNAEAAIRASEERLSNVYRAMTEGLVLQDTTGRIVECNPAAERILGLSRDQLLGRTSIDSRWQTLRADGQPYPGEEHPAMVTLRTGQPCLGIEMAIQTPGGQVNFVQINSQPLRGPDGRIEGVVCSFADVTERKRADQEMSKLALIASRTSNAVLLTDAQRRIEWVNEAFTRLSGYTLEEVRGQVPGRILQGKGTDPATVAHMRACLDRGEGFQAQIMNYSKSGREYWICSEVQPIRNALGQIERYMAIQLDITEQKQLELNLALARDQALEASRLKSEFLANMSHEIRTPMNGIIGMAGLLMETPLQTTQREMGRVIQNSAESLLLIINDILDFSKIEAGKLRIESDKFELEPLVDEALSLLIPRARQKNLALRCDFDARLNLVLLGDAGRVRQVLLNLIGNAIKFTATGEIVVAVGWLAEHEERVRLRVEVKDTGPGISAAVQRQLFQPFIQADGSTTRRFGGTGLGLAISRQLVELMGGEIGLNSEEGRGSSFWFCLELPKVAGGIPGTRSPATGVPPRTPPPRQEEIRLLVAEDNTTNQLVVRGLLENMGLVADFANNGAEALEMLARNRYDAVLMDCQMPVMDGYTATRQIRAGAVPGLDPKITIVALTAYAMPSDRQKCLDAGMDDYVPKPLRREQLLQALGCRGLAVAADASAPSAVAVPDDVLHPAQIEQLRELPGRQHPTLLQDVAEIFLRETPATLAALSDLADRLEQRETAILAHRLAGSCANLGGVRMRQAAHEVERAAEQNDRAFMREKLAVLNREWRHLQNAIQLLVADHPATCGAPGSK